VTVEVTWSEVPRSDLRWLFELAEDSAEQLNAYIDLGRVLVAREGPTVVGHLQLISGDGPLVLEVKSMAVAEDRQGQGIGRTLVDAAAAIARSEGVAMLLVSTATADVVGFVLVAAVLAMQWWMPARKPGRAPVR